MILFFAGPVIVAHGRYYIPPAAARVIHVSFVTGDHMVVQVSDRLAGGFAFVHNELAIDDIVAEGWLSNQCRPNEFLRLPTETWRCG